MQISKRKRFLITSSLLSLGFIGIQFLTDQNRFWAIGVLAALTVSLFAWSLLEGLGKDMTLTTLILPAFFTLGVGMFWFLLPGNVLARIPIVIFFGIGIYVLCLTQNIFTVSAIRTIALLRAARGVAFVLTLVTSFLVFDSILSVRAPVWIFGSLVFLSSFPLFFQGLWSVRLEKKLDGEIILLSAICSLVLSEISLILYFWPVTVVVGSLFLTASTYMLLGMFQAKLEDRLFSSTIREHLGVGVLVFIAIYFATHWGG